MKGKTHYLILASLLLLFSCVKDTSDQLATMDLIKASASEPIHLQAKNSKETLTQKVGIVPFLPAGELGGAGNVLVPGDIFPPTGTSFATLKRGKDFIHFNIHTTGLPPGTYTVWYVIFNDPAGCTAPNPAGGQCDFPDLFHPMTAVVWATGGIVQANGIGNFSDKIYIGESRDELVLQGGDLASPLANPQGAEVHLVMKYHGLPSEDPDVLYGQTHTFLGNCGPDDGANSFDDPDFGFQCFDPQLAVFPAPN